MNYLHFIQTSSSIAGIAMLYIGSRWLKQYLWTLVR